MLFTGAARTRTASCTSTPSPGQAVSAQPDGLLPITQTALQIRDDVAYHDFEGIAEDLDERERIVRDIGDKSALILRNHGTLTVGETVCDAWLRMYMLERACEAMRAVSRKEDAAIGGIAALRSLLVEPLSLPEGVETVIVSPEGALCYLPSGALFRDGDDWFAFAVVDGRAEQRRVAIGATNDVETEVREGLAPDETVILHPSDQIKSGVRVTARS